MGDRGDDVLTIDRYAFQSDPGTPVPAPDGHPEGHEHQFGRVVIEEHLHLHDDQGPERALHRSDDFATPLS